MSVVNDVYGSSQGLGKTSDGGEELPLHQKFAICSLLLILREGKSKDVTVGKVSFLDYFLNILEYSCDTSIN